MGTLLVVAVSPVLGHASDLVQGSKYIAIKNFRAVSAVEPFDIGVLLRLARLNVIYLDPPIFCPALQQSTDILRTVVAADRSRWAPPLDDLLQSPDYPLRRQREIDLNA